MLDTAVILAGGLGERLRPLTDQTPKPLLLIKNKPIVEHVIENLKNHGVKNIILSIGYKADRIKEHFGDGSKLGVNISYCVEDEPLGTGGAIKLATTGINQPVFVVWGDNLMDVNYKNLYETYLRNKTPVTMVLTPREDVENFGVAKLENEKVISFTEKPKREEAPSNLINAGAIVLEPDKLTILPEGKSSIEYDFYEKLAPGEITAYVHRGQWFPTDTLEKYQHACEEFRHLLLANQKIFKAYDIRGEWNKDWNGEFVYRIGKAIAHQLRPKTVAIGYDMRSSSPEIFEQLCKSLTEQGINVKNLGLCGTELTYFTNIFLPEIDVSIMITASHNPGKDNGIKITTNRGICLGINSGLDKIRDFALSDKKLLKTEQEGEVEKLNVWSEYKEKVINLSKIKLEEIPKFKIVIDAGNGVGGYMFDKVLGTSSQEVVRLCWDPDGNFPNHLADPFQEKNTEMLKKKVIEEQADFGIAFDGDGDRLFFIDNKGKYIPGYYFAALITDYILSQTENPEKETIAHDPRYYWATKDVIKKWRGSPVKSKVGHTLIKRKMREENSIACFECSGHTFYREMNFVESSMLTTLLVLKLISEKGNLSELIKLYFEQYPISGEINFIVENSVEILQKLEEIYSHGEVSKLDGIGIDFTNWRFNVRASNTQPLLRLNVEAKTKELVNEKVEELKEIIGGDIADH